MPSRPKIRPRTASGMNMPSKMIFFHRFIFLELGIPIASLMRCAEQTMRKVGRAKKKANEESKTVPVRNDLDVIQERLTV